MPLDLIAKIQGVNPDSKILKKNDVLSLPHPKEIKRVIDNFYNDNMIGYSENKKYTTKNDDINRSLITIKYKLKYLVNHFETVNQKQKWYSRNSEASEPLNVKKLYKEQDMILPELYRIKW
jgi:hypothetical protein